MAVFMASFMALNKSEDALDGNVNITFLSYLKLANCLATDFFILSTVTTEASPPGITAPSFQSVTVTLSIMALSLPIFNL